MIFRISHNSCIPPYDFTDLGYLSVIYTKLLKISQQIYFVKLNI